MDRRRNRNVYWALWGILSIGAGAYLLGVLMNEDAVSNAPLANKQLFLPGKTSHGHHQIELACEACHKDAFAGREALQKACVECHGAELQEANDSHPKRLFTDPRNADMLAKIDAAECVACHAEHKPEITHAVGVTVPQDHCMVCHRDIAEARFTHKNLKPESCAAAGCHNYHDNRALYEEFLLKHLREPALLDSAQVRPRDFAERVANIASYPAKKFPLRPLSLAEHDGASALRSDARLRDDWATTGHAKAGVNCSACHFSTSGNSWTERPDEKVCANCHEPEVNGWLASMHGMRIAQKLPAMTPALAQLPMKHDAFDKELSCNSCHAAHRFDVKVAAIDDCLGCHDDKHTRAYRDSPHHQAWLRELRGEAPPGSGVSCATCHLPRVAHRDSGTARTLVQHNQNDNLRPNSKMLRSVCLDCHGLEFALDALSDVELIANNFKGHPTEHVASPAMAERAQKVSKQRPQQRR